MEGPMRRILAGLLLFLLVTPAFAGPYLFELLEIKGYSKGFNALLAGEKTLPAWVKTFAKSMDGVAAPSADIQVDGTDYVYATVCKPHDCWGKTLHVVFANGGEQAWGLLEEPGANDSAPFKTRLLGHPDKAMAAALQAKVQQN
jgi:hypothetical protein